MEYEMENLSDVQENQIEMEEDENSEPLVRPRKKNVKKLACGIGAVVVFLLCIVAVVVVTVPVVIVFSAEKPPPVVHTIEFQIDLKPMKAWKDRESMVSRWITSMNQYTSLFQLERNNATEDVYMQYHLIGTSEKRCSIPEDIKLRFRSFVYSKENSVDLKGKEDSWLKSCSEPFWPAEKYYENSKQKCEEDFHPCFDKYTRGTSVAFDDPHKSFPYCKDLVDVFPYAFPSVTEDNAMNRISASGKTYWWKLQWRVDMDDYTFEINFTMEYDRVDQAEGITESAINEGEWSGRIYSSGKQSWDSDVIDQFKNMYYSLVLEFDTTNQEHMDCANDFFE